MSVTAELVADNRDVGESPVWDWRDQRVHCA